MFLFFCLNLIVIDSIELNWIRVNVNVLLCVRVSGNFWNRLMLILLNGSNDMCFGWMRELCPRLTKITTTSLLWMDFSPRYIFV